MLSTFADPRRRSLLRGSLLVLASLFAALAMAGLGADRPSLKLAFPTITALLGSADTFRCLRHRWDFYHGAVVLMLYADVMVLTIILFLFLYPYSDSIL